jgi:hypothetical protein
LRAATHSTAAIRGDTQNNESNYQGEIRVSIAAIFMARRRSKHNYANMTNRHHVHVAVTLRAPEIELP